MTSKTQRRKHFLYNWKEKTKLKKLTFTINPLYKSLSKAQVQIYDCMQCFTPINVAVVLVRIE